MKTLSMILILTAFILGSCFKTKDDPNQIPKKTPPKTTVSLQPSSPTDTTPTIASSTQSSISSSDTDSSSAKITEITNQVADTSTSTFSVQVTSDPNPSPSKPQITDMLFSNNQIKVTGSNLDKVTVAALKHANISDNLTIFSIKASELILQTVSGVEFLANIAYDLVISTAQAETVTATFTVTPTIGANSISTDKIQDGAVSKKQRCKMSS